MNSEHQKCVASIQVEPNQWVQKGGNPIQLSVYLKWSKPVATFRYVPRYSEIRSMIGGLVQIYGEEEVKKEIGVILMNERESENARWKGYEEQNQLKGKIINEENEKRIAEIIQRCDNDK